MCAGGGGRAGLYLGVVESMGHAPQMLHLTENGDSRSTSNATK